MNNPLWVKVWHWSNALFFIVLLLSGISLRFGVVFDFDTARLIHNIFGISLSVMWLFFIIMNIVTGHMKHYHVRLKGLVHRLIKQGIFYGLGIFQGKHHPYHETENMKFNPLQQVTYVVVTGLGMPALITTGIAFFFPQVFPVILVATAHFLIVVITLCFVISHLYILTCGEDGLLGELKKML